MIVKWISFDVWGTLIKANPAYRPARNKLIAEILFPELKERFDDLDWDSLITSAKRFSDYANEALGQQLSWQQSILMVMKDYTSLLDKSAISERFETYRLNNEALIDTIPPLVYSRETVVVLELLKAKGIPMQIICNTGFTNWVGMSKIMHKLQLSQYFSTSTYSDVLGKSKPNPDIFRGSYYAKNVEEGLHVGDNAFADGGCIAVGVKFLQINGESGNTISQLLKYV